jgi:Holliday junction resolvase RusA-like endonuclease
MIGLKIKPLSVNKAWKGKRYKTDEYKAYEKAVLLMLPNIEIPEGHLHVSLEFGFSNKASDLDNPIKPFIDILQKKYGFNDSRIYEYDLKKKKTIKGADYIMFDIKEAEL